MSTDSESPSEGERIVVHDAHGEFVPPRRSFLYQFWAGFLGLIAGLIPGGVGLAFFLDPLVRKEGDNQEGGVEFVPVASFASLPEDGTPMLFTVYKDRVDKWNKFPNERVGSVWLRRIEKQVLAFNSVCPHLGCSVDYRAANGDFYCPCHASAFDLDGEKKNVIPPRGMDTLESKLTDDGEILVAFENFQGGIHEKEPVA